MAKRSRAAARRICLLRVLDLLHTHITGALCHGEFGRVRTTERQRDWTLEALVQLWTAVILRAPPALGQALADAVEGREPLFPRIPATPEAFFQRRRDLRAAFFAAVFQAFTARLVPLTPPRFAAELAPLQGRFADLLILYPWAKGPRSSSVSSRSRWRAVNRGGRPGRSRRASRPRWGWT
jgi:hypothetical protein